MAVEPGDVAALNEALAVEARRLADPTRPSARRWPGAVVDGAAVVRVARMPHRCGVSAARRRGDLGGETESSLQSPSSG